MRACVFVGGGESLGRFHGFFDLPGQTPKIGQAGVWSVFTFPGLVGSLMTAAGES